MNENTTETNYQDTQPSRNTGKNMSSEDYEKEIEHTREEINETLHSLENKLSPRELWNQTIDEWGEGMKDFSGNFGKAIRDNPVPAVLMGMSMLWLMTGSGSANSRFSAGNLSRRTDRFRNQYSGAKHRAGDKVDEVSGKIKSTYYGMKAKATETLEGVSDKIKDVSEDMDHYGDQFRHKQGSLKRKLRGNGSDITSNPLLLAAAGIALGSIAALSMPMTRKEKELIDTGGRKLREKAEEIGHEQLETGKKTVAAAGEAVRKEMAREEKESKDN